MCKCASAAPPPVCLEKSRGFWGGGAHSVITTMGLVPYIGGRVQDGPGTTKFLICLGPEVHSGHRALFGSVLGFQGMVKTRGQFV